MNRIQQHLEAEKQKETPDDYTINHLEKVLKNGVITQSEWTSLKVHIPVEQFLKDNPDETLREDCDELIVYVGGYYIQKLKSGVFFINDDIPLIDSIYIAQKELWDLCLDELWK